MSLFARPATTSSITSRSRSVSCSCAAETSHDETIGSRTVVPADTERMASTSWSSEAVFTRNPTAPALSAART